MAKLGIIEHNLGNISTDVMLLSPEMNNHLVTEGAIKQAEQVRTTNIIRHHLRRLTQPMREILQNPEYALGKHITDYGSEGIAFTIPTLEALNLLPKPCQSLLALIGQPTEGPEGSVYELFNLFIGYVPPPPNPQYFSGEYEYFLSFPLSDEHEAIEQLNGISARVDDNATILRFDILTGGKTLPNMIVHALKELPTFKALYARTLFEAVTQPKVITVNRLNFEAAKDFFT